MRVRSTSSPGGPTPWTSLHFGLAPGTASSAYMGGELALLERDEETGGEDGETLACEPALFHLIR